MDLWEDSISQVSMNRRHPDDTMPQVSASGRHGNYITFSMFHIRCAFTDIATHQTRLKTPISDPVCLLTSILFLRTIWVNMSKMNLSQMHGRATCGRELKSDVTSSGVMTLSRRSMSASSRRQAHIQFALWSTVKAYHAAA